MANPFDQFDAAPMQAAGGGNPFDRFDAPSAGSIPQPQGAMQNIRAGIGETLANVGSGIVAAPVAGFAGIGTAAGNALGLTDRQPGDVVRSVQSALTYQPRTDAGKAVSGAVAYPLQKLAQGADYAGSHVADFTRPVIGNEASAALGAGVNTAIQGLPALLFRRGGAIAKGAESAAPGAAEAAAKSYVQSRTSLDWNSLSDAVKTRLTDIAGKGAALEQLDPAAVASQAKLESLPVPITSATRGQLTRDPVQLRNEGNVSATDAGKPLSDAYVDQNQKILDNLALLKGKTGGKAVTQEQTGQSVQGALRAKLDAQKALVSDMYDRAKSTGEMEAPVSVQPIRELIANTPDTTHYGFVNAWLNKMGGAVDRETTPAQTVNKFVKTPDGPKWQKVTIGEPTTTTTAKSMTLNELEDLRQAAVAKAMNGGTDGYYAGKLIRTIDGMTDGAGGTAYQAARAARKAQAMQFEEPGSIAQLVENSSRTDRATALEDTWKKTVVNGSIEDLNTVKRALLSNDTSGKGRQAWRDLKAQTLQHITDEATKGVAPNKAGTPNVTPAAMKRAIASVGPEKLEALFGPGTVRNINKIMDATVDLKTEPPARHPGSSTMGNVLAFLEKGIGKVPVLGDVTSGIVRGGVKLHEMGRAGREVRAAQETPLDQAEALNRNELANRRVKNSLIGLTPSQGGQR